MAAATSGEFAANARVVGYAPDAIGDGLGSGVEGVADERLHARTPLLIELEGFLRLAGGGALLLDEAVDAGWVVR